MERAYYAHAKATYGTPREKSELKWLRRHFSVLDPNRDMGELGSSEPYLKALMKCGLVVCSEHKGYLHHGTYAEVKHALTNKKRVKVIRKTPRGYVLLDVTKAVIIDINSIDGRYGAVVARMFDRR